MNPLDLILIKMSEEASEVAEAASRIAKACSKSFRFGLDSTYQGASNVERILLSYDEMVEEVFDTRVAMLIFLTIHQQTWDIQLPNTGAYMLDGFSATEKRKAIQKLDRFTETMAVTLERMSITLPLDTLPSIIQGLRNALEREANRGV